MKLTFFSSLVGGLRRIIMSGAYANVRMAIPNSIHSNPMVFTRVPLIAGPVQSIHFGQKLVWAVSDNQLYFIIFNLREK